LCARKRPRFSICHSERSEESFSFLYPFHISLEASDFFVLEKVTKKSFSTG